MKNTNNFENTEQVISDIELEKLYNDLCMDNMELREYLYNLLHHVWHPPHNNYDKNKLLQRSGLVAFSKVGYDENGIIHKWQITEKGWIYIRKSENKLKV